MLKVYPLVALLMSFSEVLCMSNEMKEMIDNLHKTCVGEAGVDEALIARVNAERAFPDDEKLKCYVKCIMTQTEIMGDDGMIDVEAAIAILPEEMRSRAEPIIKTCGTKVGANACESAWLTHKCYLENDPMRYMLI